MPNQVGKQAQRSRVFLNPYPDMRCTRCPTCSISTLRRTGSLVIPVDLISQVALNTTYHDGPACDLLIAHHHETEEQLALLFARDNPSLIGNDYLVIGTQDCAV